MICKVGWLTGGKFTVRHWNVGRLALVLTGMTLAGLVPLGCSSRSEYADAAQPVRTAPTPTSTPEAAPAAPTTPTTPASASADASALPNQIVEGEMEFLVSGDFNGDGLLDVAIVSRTSGRVRFGYRVSAEFFNWADWRASGAPGVAGVSVGRLVDARHDSLALVSADENRITVLDGANPNIPTDPVVIPCEVQGPSVVAAVDIGGAGNTPLLDLYVGSIYNTDPENRLTLYRNAGNKFTQIYNEPAKGTATRSRRVTLKTNGPEAVASLVTTEEGKVWRVESLAGGKPETLLMAAGIPDGENYFLGNFRGQSPKEVVFHEAGEASFSVGALAETGGQWQLGELKSVALRAGARSLTGGDLAGQSRLLAIFGDQEPAELMQFDGVNAPVTVQKLDGATNEFLSLGIVLPDAVVLFSVTTNDRPRDVSYYQVHLLKEGKLAAGAFGALPTLDDRDDNTIPEIYKRIVATQQEKTQADMKAYTNVIPGTQVTFAMTPIPGGEFVMGSPDNEAGHKPDESPQHKVKIEPFWMGTYEVTWDEYLLFVYPDDEKKLRETFPTDPEINAISDAVSHPSKPYMDMSFGMGKRGFPAIAMTQHAANKFCHWLSAKTGQFYRLPTEAEWEYACRAGTTTAYSFGDDPNDLPEYAWFFDNSNSKYQRVGKKKPNPWGLYDMHGNVVEWVLDQYNPDYYKSLGPAVVTEPWNKATKPYPHSVRGGSWDDDAPALRSAARRGSERAWKMTDPQLPKGMWWFTDVSFVGFRIVRPLQIPPPEQMAKYWISGVEKD
ncbi:MAG TPA: SUMF1/EgtB/PvdO family nonheme iron enzyme [Verrucomicrobiota bacterium]|nr:SUMF1/EgtB/PvdO family nonheme iron enzyme [Verrucomicrobiota bacterium]